MSPIDTASANQVLLYYDSLDTCTRMRHNHCGAWYGALARRGDTHSNPRQLLAMLVLRDGGETFIASAAKALSHSTDDRIETSESTLTFTMRGIAVHFGVIGQPIPWSALEGPCSTATWLNAAQVFRPHQSHVIAFAQTLTEPSSLVPCAGELARAISRVAELPDVLGAYFGSAGAVHSTQTLRDLVPHVDNAESIMKLWFSCRWGLNANGSKHAFTQGLEAFGCPELEIHESARDGVHLQTLLEQLAIKLTLTPDSLADDGTLEYQGETIQLLPQHSMWNASRGVLLLRLT